MLRRRMFDVTLALLIAIACAVMAKAAHADETLAIVVQDSVSMRASPRDSSPQQAVLWQGEALEVRGRRVDFVQVYDHRRERGGFVRASALRVLALDESAAPELLAVVRFVRETPGMESLGIGYVAAYLKAAPAKAIGAEPFDALGTMAERLAKRASTNKDKTKEAALAAHLEVAASYGVAIKSLEREGRMTLCYDGDAFRRVLALDASPESKARAALALTRPDCVDPNLTPREIAALDDWRAQTLARVPRLDLPPYWRNRVRLRNALVQASLAFERTRRGESPVDAATLALEELAGVDKNELSDDDQSAYADAAVRVGATRWAAVPDSIKPTTGALELVAEKGQPGETCLKVFVAKRDAKTPPLATRCTFGQPWVASARANANGSAMTLAVQPLDGWLELWVVHAVGPKWQVDVLPPGEDAAGPGYVEFAGFVPGKRELLVAREARVGGKLVRSFELLDLDTLAIKQHADKPASLTPFARWQDPAWKRATVSLR